MAAINPFSMSHWTRQARFSRYEAKMVFLCNCVGTSKSQLSNAIAEVRGAGSVDSAMGDQQFEALSKYGQDLTAKAARLDPVIGRDEEIRRSVRILCRRTKNNPVLIGEPGTALPVSNEGLQIVSLPTGHLLLISPCQVFKPPASWMLKAKDFAPLTKMCSFRPKLLFRTC